MASKFLVRSYIFVILWCYLSFVTATGLWPQVGRFVNSRETWTTKNSPFIISWDVIVTEEGELTIHPGVEVRFSVGVGLTVRGVIRAKGTDKNRIVFTHEKGKRDGQQSSFPSDVRLVDGPSVSQGALQFFHNQKWRYICASRNWTEIDFNVACRSLGFARGEFYQWFDEYKNVKSLEYSTPNCFGRENSLTECDWSSRRMGKGVCDLHSHIGIRCIGQLNTINDKLTNWRGIWFQNAKFVERSIMEFGVYKKRSLSDSILENVDILNAGYNKTGDLTSALIINGVAPVMNNITVRWSAYNAVNLSLCSSEVEIINSKISENRGHGIAVNRSLGLISIRGSDISLNGGDGIHFDIQEFDQMSVDGEDFCSSPNLNFDQQYPVNYLLRQRAHLNPTSCFRDFTVRPGHVLTVHILKIKNSVDNSGTVIISDGREKTSRQLMKFIITNSTKPHSVVSTGPHLRIDVQLHASVDVELLLQVNVGTGKAHDLRISESTIKRNNGVGVYARNLKSMIEVVESVIEGNTHLGGIIVHGGSGDVNVTNSWITDNSGDGVNITMEGGRSNLTRSTIGKNDGYGLAVWLSRPSPTVEIPQRTIVTQCEIDANGGIGVLIGKHWTDPVVNVTMTNFRHSRDIALKVVTVDSYEDFDSTVTKLFVTHNTFVKNERVSVEILPPHAIDAVIEHNGFTGNLKECLVIGNRESIKWARTTSKLLIQENVFERNRGVFVASLGAPNGNNENFVHFTHNYVKHNEITEHFPSLNPRSNVAAVVVISSTNVVVYRNIFDNKQAKYEIGSHVMGREKLLNCSLNSFGTIDIKIIDERIFDCKYRFHLACIQYKPYLRIFTDFDTSYISSELETNIPEFQRPGSNEIGGEISGRINLDAGTYVIKKDIFVRPNGQLNVKPHVLLQFDSSVGMMVQGKLEMKGGSYNESGRIVLTSSVKGIAPDTTQVRLTSSSKYAHLVYEGRLEMKVNGKWGTVCNYGWTKEAAALACRQMGYLFIPDDWQIPGSNISENVIFESIIASNMKCHFLDEILSRCKFDDEHEIENTCTHDDDVHLRCYEPKWLGLRLGLAADEAVLEYVDIDSAGFYDYDTGTFQSALQIDLMHHRLKNIRVTKNIYAGVGVVFNNYFNNPEVLKIRESNVSSNLGHGILTHTPGLGIQYTFVTNNTRAGIYLEPRISHEMREEISQWIAESRRMSVLKLPDPFGVENDIDIQRGESVAVITEKLLANVSSSVLIRTDGASAFGIQILNPISSGSTEVIEIVDGFTEKVLWKLNDNVTSFPAVAEVSSLEVRCVFGARPRGGVIIYITAIDKNEHLIFDASNPQLKIYRTVIAANYDGLRIHHYDDNIDEDNNWNARVFNQSIHIDYGAINHHQGSAIYVKSALATRINDVMVNNTYFLKEVHFNSNVRGIVQIADDLLNSKNVFAWSIRNCRFEHNLEEVVNLTVPYVWNTSVPLHHLFDVSTNVFVDNGNFQFIIDGYFAKVNLLENRFHENICPKGLITIRGMEKEIWISRNAIEKNYAKHLVKFDAKSHTKLSTHVEAYFKNNKVQGNYAIEPTHPDDPMGSDFNELNFAVGVFGIQKVNVTNNFLGPNNFDYLFVSGMRSNSLQDFIDVRENWWGTDNVRTIWNKILDSDDSYNYASTRFIPFYKTESYSGGVLSHDQLQFLFMFEDLGGPLTENMEFRPRDKPYVVSSDLTIMPGVTLTIQPGVEMTFHPNVGVLVLGKLIAKGTSDKKIVMRPISRRKSRSVASRTKRELSKDVRLCFDGKCTDWEKGFVEVFNHTTKQWIPVCDSGFTEKSAEVVCNHLAPFDDVYSEGSVKFGPRYDMGERYFSRIQSWMTPKICSGRESSLTHCPPRVKMDPLPCTLESDFVFIHCHLVSKSDVHWGGITFAPPNYDPHISTGPADMPNQISTQENSILQYVVVKGAGNLHGNKVAAIQALYNLPNIIHTEVSNSASHGITIVAPKESINIQHSKFTGNRGVGINIIDFRRETRDSRVLMHLPLTPLFLPRELFGMVAMCDADKIISVQDRILLYYKYSQEDSTCVKIFRGAHQLGFRLLYLNLFRNYGADNDFVRVYDGDSSSDEKEELIKLSGTMEEFRVVVESKRPTLSVQIVASAASEVHGFVAEIFAVPPISFSFDEEKTHLISNCDIVNNDLGGLFYSSFGEVNPILTISSNLISSNGILMLGNFTSTECAVRLNLQNSNSVKFQNNVVYKNQGGLCITSESGSNSKQAQIFNNLFTGNVNHPTLKVISHNSSTYQVLIRNNIFTFNNLTYQEMVKLNEVVSTSFGNYFSNNTGRFLMSINFNAGYSNEPYQYFHHNTFLNNTSLHEKTKGTILVGSSRQNYLDNVFTNPANDFELVTTEGLGLINASRNWWGYNHTFAVRGRILDKHDHSNLVEVVTSPFYDQPYLIDEDCLAGWKRIGGECHQYVGGYLTQIEAERYCNIQNSTVSYIKSDFVREFDNFIKSAQQYFDDSVPVRVQTIEFVPTSSCSALLKGKITTVSCHERYPFVCAWGVDWASLAAAREMNLAILIGASIGAAVMLLACIIFCICRRRHLRKGKDSYTPHRKGDEEVASRHEMVALTKESSDPRLADLPPPQQKFSSFIPQRFVDVNRMPPTAEEDSVSLDEDKKSLSQETLPLVNKDGIEYRPAKPYLETSLDNLGDDDDDDDVPKKKYLETSLDYLDKDGSEA